MRNGQIILKNVSKTIRGKNILDHIDLTLDAGKIYGVFGRNGSGKTMLLRAIAGLIRVEGSVSVFGKQISRDGSFPDSVGLVIEKSDMWGQMNAIDNLKLLAGIRNEIGEAEIRDALERVGLNPGDIRNVRMYSMGMKQKLTIAQAIMEKPDLLLLDEPTNGLDDNAVENFRRIIREEKERGCTVIVATHQKEDVIDLCDRTFRISEGRCEETEASV